LNVEVRDVLMEPFVVIGTPVNTDDHRRRSTRGLENLTVVGDMPPTVGGEHDCLRRIGRYVGRDRAAPVVLERFGDQLPISGRHRRGLLASTVTE